MTRRQLIIAGLLAPVGTQVKRSKVGQRVSMDALFIADEPVENYTAIEVDLNLPKDVKANHYYALTFKYGNEIVKFTPEEVMKALKDK